MEQSGGKPSGESDWQVPYSLEEMKRPGLALKKVLVLQAQITRRWLPDTGEEDLERYARRSRLPLGLGDTRSRK